MLDNLRPDTEQRMAQSVEALRQELGKLRTGRAQPSLLEHIIVDYYGTPTPLNQVAGITVLDARTLQVQPWEKKMLPEIEKTILQSDLGLNPTTGGDSIRIPLPPLTEERRRELVKLAKAEAEKARVSVRNARRDANELCKKALKEKNIGEDEERRHHAEIQKLTDHYIEEIDKTVAHKEQELLAI